MLSVLSIVLSKLSDICLAPWLKALSQAVLFAEDGCYAGQGLALDGFEHGVDT